jgi:multiple sugar transport system substrate-binding protein
MRQNPSSVRLIGCLVAATALLAGCDQAAPTSTPSSTPSSSQSPSPTPTPEPVTLQVGVWGAEPEVAAYRAVLTTYDVVNPALKIDVTAFESREALMEVVRRGAVPDVFLADRDDLDYLLANGVTQPLGERLDERDVDFGDDYSRSALEAFSFDRDLQCMPYGIDPAVVYYNADLVDFERMARRELDVPDLDPDSRPRWTLEQFRVAAEFATRPNQGTRGFHVEQDLDGIAPFLLSAGGDVYNDQTSPTSLAFSSEDSLSALEKVLPVLRDAQISLTSDQLAEASPVEWFTRGRLGMIVGNRTLTPQLRAVEGLDFGVMPIPTAGASATIADITGLCISADTQDLAASADLLVYLISGDAVRRVVPAGYLLPANQTVALTQDFLQSDRLPARADVFTQSAGDIVVAPVVEDPALLRAVVDPAIAQLFTVGVPNLEQLAAAIDGASQSVLRQQPEESPTPTEAAE